MTRHKNSHIDIGPLSSKGGGKHFLPEPAYFQAPSRFCNAAMPSMTPEEVRRVLPAAPRRPGSLIAFTLPSRGTGC